MQTDAPTNMPLLHIKDFSLQFLSQGEKVTQVLEHINLRVSPGETCALVGESGSGKPVTATGRRDKPHSHRRFYSIRWAEHQWLV